MKKTKTKRKKNEVRDYFNTKPMTMPDKFTPGFLQELDKRSVVYQGVRKSYNQLVDDLGGESNLSHARIVLIERFVFGECLAQNLEACILAKPQEKLVQRWLSVTKALGALAIRIGLERTRRPVDCLQSYVKKSKSKKKRKSQ